MSAPTVVDRILAPVDRASAAIWSDDVEVAESIRVPVATLLRWGLVLAVLGALGQGVIHVANSVFLDFRFGLLNADADGGVFTWASSVATFAVAGAVALVALQVRTHRALLVVTVFIVTFLSLDDSVALHERISISQIGPIEHASRILWVTVSMPLLAAAFVGLAILARRAPADTGRCMMLGLWMLVIAIVLEFVSPLVFALGSDHGDLLYEVEAAIEEGLELAGWIVIAAGAGGAALLLAARGGVRPGR
jgi:hypothetical protein